MRLAKIKTPPPGGFLEKHLYPAVFSTKNVIISDIKSTTGIYEITIKSDLAAMLTNILHFFLKIDKLTALQKGAFDWQGILVELTSHMLHLH